MGFTKKVAKEKKSIGADIEDTIKSIQTKFGEGAIMKLGDSPKVDIDVIPTGSLGLDMALGVGGVPRGRIIEIFGPESSGKTTLALHIVAEAQKKGGICAYIDAEHAMDPVYAKNLGVKLIPIPNASKDILRYFKELPIKRVILTGGQDVNPSFYNQKSAYSKDFSNSRDKTEMSLLEIAVERGMPVFCNCRGMQFMNVFFGGSLIQDIEKQHSKRIKHVGTSHEVEVVDNNAYELLKKRHFVVNSYHNQGITKGNLSKAPFRE